MPRVTAAPRSSRSARSRASRACGFAAPAGSSIRSPRYGAKCSREISPPMKDPTRSIPEAAMAARFCLRAAWLRANRELTPSSSPGTFLTATSMREAFRFPRPRAPPAAAHFQMGHLRFGVPSMLPFGTMRARRVFMWNKTTFPCGRAPLLSSRLCFPQHFRRTCWMRSPQI